MAKSHRYIIVFWALWCVATGVSALAEPLWIEVEGGNTAFEVDPERRTAYWVLDDCKRPIPLESSGKRGILQSTTLQDRVELGSRQVELRQQFRFNLVADPARVEVYNSVRGGWAPVPVRVSPTCHPAAVCRERMELPECPGGI